jgi:hypothetical protein
MPLRVEPKWIVSIVVVAVSTMVLTLMTAIPARADIPGDVRYDGDFIRSLQLSSGAIMADASRQLVDPYVANYAAWGLARATRYAGDPVYAGAALKWLTWYQAHMDATGVVHDYRPQGKVLQATDDEDSVDACSGVFLLATRELYRASTPGAGRALLDKLKPAITKAIRAIGALRDSDGMTWAKPSWHVKYLMDNTEAYGGLLAGADLANALGMKALAEAAAKGAAQSKAGILTLWNPATHAYDWALHGDGYRQTANWQVLYPDSVEQAWTVAFGVSDSARAGDLMAMLAEAQPRWDQPTATATYWDGAPYAHAVDFWSMVGWSFDSIGQQARGAAAAANIRNGAWLLNRQPPYTSGAQGQLIVLESGGP